ncbi:MAG: hypothetical protein Q7J57_14675 [Gemmobacter sp.]|nr:hypothetical protein [Gemmobacter sp.]
MSILSSVTQPVIPDAQTVPAAQLPAAVPAQTGLPSPDARKVTAAAPKTHDTATAKARIDTAESLVHAAQQSRLRQAFLDRIADTPAALQASPRIVSEAAETLTPYADVLRVFRRR